MVASRLSSVLSTSSSSAVTVTVCGVFQLLALKVSLAGLMVATSSSPASVTTTSSFLP